MNYNTLKKCVEELQKDKPRIDYVLGLLEALLDAQNVGQVLTPLSPNILNKSAVSDVNPSVSTEDDLAKIMDREVASKLKAIKAATTLTNG